MITKDLFEFCIDLETDQVSTRDVNTRGVMGWGREASEDLSRLCLLFVVLKRGGLGAYKDKLKLTNK